MIPGLYRAYPSVVLDLVTCYAGAPAGFNTDTGRIYRVSDYPGTAGRRKLFAELLANRYPIAGMICSAEPIMTKWKWAIALRLPAKVFVLNENGDYFWLDRTHLRTMVHFVLFRAGLTGPDAVPTLGRLFLFSFMLVYLLLYAAAVHLRRKVQT